MNLFFSPPVRTYSLLASHHQVCGIVDVLISTGFVQFQMLPYDDSSDPFYIIYSRIRQLKYRLSGVVQSIKQKYKQKQISIGHEERIETVGRMKDYIEQKKIDYLSYLDMEEGVINQRIKKLTNITSNYDSILNSIENIQEELDVLKVKKQLLSKDYNSQEFTVLSGACNVKDRSIIQRLLFRKTHGHSYVIFKDRPGTLRDIFLCFVNKMVYKNISTKIINILNLNKAVLYELPNKDEHLSNYQQTLVIKQKQYLKLCQISSQQLGKVLKESMSAGEVSLQHHLIRLTFLERIIYIICHSKPIGSPPNHVLLTVHVPQSEHLPVIPVPVIPIVDGKHKQRTIMPRINCLFQVNILTELYSTPRYNQILPSVFMFSTVPILFGMMFSDIGHGLMLLVISLLLKLNPIFYFMSFMSIYCGIIYNQFFGMKILHSSNLGILNGIWGVSQNGMNFQNSLKMKLSMIIAFIHMTFGIILKMINQLKRGQNKIIIFDSIPKLVLMFSTVGYLVYLIIIKWITNYKGAESTAPSIINTMLQLYLGYSQTRKVSILGSMQTEKSIGRLMNTISLICVGVMVFNHTFRNKCQLLYYQFQNGKAKKGQKYEKLEDEDQIDDQMNRQLSQTSEISNLTLSKTVSYYHESDSHESELGPLQVFEYVLSLISSTTSYLRLFALSLAHGKLSHLLLTFLLSTLSAQQPSISILRCLVFFITTMLMMLSLDVMQCMMHVVRLHWVEWMGKFYTGSGAIFKPEIEEHYT